MQNAPETSISPDTNRTTLYAAPEGHDARILIERAHELMRDDKILVHVALDDARVYTLENLIRFFGSDVKILTFPAWDCLPYDRVSPSNDLMAQRMATLHDLTVWNFEKERHPRILLTTINALTQKVPPKEIFQSASFHAKENGDVDIQILQDFLERSGYLRTDTVRDSGEYSIRGGIIDIFPAGYKTPIRLDLFGDRIESIKTFDPETQTSLAKIKEFAIKPSKEYILDDVSIQRFRAKYRETFGVPKSNDPLYESISEGRRYNGMEHWLPLFYKKMETLSDYAEKYELTFDAHSDQSHSERMDQIEDFYQARKTLEASQTQKKSKDVSLSGTTYHPLPPSALYLTQKEWDGLSEGSAVLSSFADPSKPDNVIQAARGRDFADIRALPDGDIFGAFKNYISGFKDQKILITSVSEGGRERLKGLLEHEGISDLKPISSTEDLRKIKSGQIAMGLLDLAHGFTSADLIIVTEQDLLGDRLGRGSKKRKKAENFLREVSSLDVNDLVVHIEHGIGRFEGLETLNAAGTHHDCLKIIYAGGDKLFVPVENIDVLSRFGSDEGTTQLDKLGGAGWQARKAKVKKDLMRIASKLLDIAAARKLQKADPLELDADKYYKFAARFPYQETEDQERSIESVLEDLASDHPMDRLVCGDVGFGKTEVAIRAAYVAAQSGAQVAVVVPTTLLARQHYANFIKRFEGTGIRVAQLSRMVDSKDAQNTKKCLQNGSVHIVIGTHALFAKDIKFAHLGLLIIDEEQRFGVKQKEKIKEIKSNVHVLTLTATPIPRTLQMSLTGVKELSLITTPPVDRLAIRTFVLPYDPMVLREALMRERYRGGQSFYVCPRIKDLREVEDQLKELVPELKIVTAHGQMPPTDLDERMTAFYDGQYDILLATNIIESGIDIPSANTMIVHHADMFGLAQLYQIRGRIGRSKVRAYAYLTYEPTKKLTDQGQKRLEVISTLDNLGAGFQLASHDMDIRGAGNLLGEEQSGHIKEVGVELYQQMLEEAVAAAREGIQLETDQDTATWSPQINIGSSVLIPEHYVEDLGVRMNLYRRLGELHETQDIEKYAAEMIDRFGPLPDEFENLLEIAKIKLLCKQAGVDRVDAGPKGAVIGFRNDMPPNPEGLFAWLTQKKGLVKLRPDQRLSAPREWPNLALRTRGVIALIKDLASLV
jgi:transcription-repair coupling factor (superfamily II helicase)